MDQTNAPTQFSDANARVDAVLAALKDVSFPASTQELTNRNLRTLLEQAAPLVMKGTIRSIQAKVNEVLAAPITGDSQYGLRLIFALQDSWQYVHWDCSRGAIPADRQRMRELYRELWDSRDDGITPF